MRSGQVLRVWSGNVGEFAGDPQAAVSGLVRKGILVALRPRFPNCTASQVSDSLALNSMGPLDKP
jgi:hypothetical protein